jgi:hypothetical protein
MMIQSTSRYVCSEWYFITNITLNNGQLEFMSDSRPNTLSLTVEESES